MTILAAHLPPAYSKWATKERLMLNARDPRTDPKTGDSIRTTSGDVYTVVYSEACVVSRNITRPDGHVIRDVYGPVRIWAEWATGATVLVLA